MLALPAVSVRSCEAIATTQKQMAELFGKDVRTISEHVGNVYADGELEENPTIRKFRIVRQVQRELKHYNLDAIVSVGYRVKSLRGVCFLQWATRVLHEHLPQGTTSTSTGWPSVA